MRSITAFFLSLLMLILCSCGSQPANTSTLPPTEPILDPSGYVVDGVMEYPDYTFSSTPSPLELRLKAVAAFKDLLSVRWSLSNEITYNKTGPVSGKTFHHDADVTYAGTIYSNANTGLFQFLEFYDFTTGRINYPGDVEEFKENLGASCADAMIWGLTAVCNSITGPYYPVSMVYKNGYLPVGDYTYDFNITSYNLCPTYKIVEDNGKDVILDAYTKVRPGDMFTSSPDNHGMMAISIPTVLYLEDGSIDIENSYVMIQDQRGGQGAGFYEVEEGGQTIRYSGRTSAKFTFAKLLEKSYLPVTTAEFAGTKEYEACTASIDRECGSVKELLDATVSSNYPLAVVNVLAADSHGNVHVLGRKLFSGGERHGVPREFALSKLECLQDFQSSNYYDPGYMLRIEVIPATGERFIVTEIPAQ